MDGLVSVRVTVEHNSPSRSEAWQVKHPLSPLTAALLVIGGGSGSPVQRHGVMARIHEHHPRAIGAPAEAVCHLEYHFGIAAGLIGAACLPVVQRMLRKHPSANGHGSGLLQAL